MAPPGLRENGGGLDPPAGVVTAEQGGRAIGQVQGAGKAETRGTGAGHAGEGYSRRGAQCGEDVGDPGVDAASRGFEVVPPAREFPDQVIETLRRADQGAGH